MQGSFGATRPGDRKPFVDNILAVHKRRDEPRDVRFRRQLNGSEGTGTAVRRASQPQQLRREHVRPSTLCK